MNMNFGQEFVRTDVGTNGGQSNFLKGNAIYNVKLKEIREDSLESKDKEGNVKTYDILTLVFAEVDEHGNITNDSKVFEDKTFELNEKSTERHAYKTRDGKEKHMPSAYESTVLKFRCYMEQLCPNFYAKLLSGEQKFSFTSWKDFKKTFIALFSKVIASDKNPICQLKLLKKNNFAVLPNFCALTKDEQSYFLSNAFIGNINFEGKNRKEIVFSDYELKQIKAEEAAKNATTTSSELLKGMEENAQSSLESSDLSNIDVAGIDLDNI